MLFCTGSFNIWALFPFMCLNAKTKVSEVTFLGSVEEEVGEMDKPPEDQNLGERGRRQTHTPLLRIIVCTTLSNCPLKKKLSFYFCVWECLTCMYSLHIVCVSGVHGDQKRVRGEPGTGVTDGGKPLCGH